MTYGIGTVDDAPCRLTESSTASARRRRPPLESPLCLRGPPAARGSRGPDEVLGVMDAVAAESCAIEWWQGRRGTQP
jgi:hypothetical protein